MKFDYQGKSHQGGIYRILNENNGRFYLGSCKEFKRRSKQHHNALKSGKHSNKYLQADFAKCGDIHFKFEILEVIEGGKQKRIDIEQVYLSKHFDACKGCYNMSKNASSSEGRPFSNTPEETRKKMSDAAKKRLSNPANHPLYGKKFSEESRRKMSESHKGQIPVNVKTYDIRLQSPDGEIVGPIHNLHKFCRDNELRLGNMCMVLSGKRKHHKQWKLLQCEKKQ